MATEPIAPLPEMKGKWQRRREELAAQAAAGNGEAAYKLHKNEQNRKSRWTLRERAAQGDEAAMQKYDGMKEQMRRRRESKKAAKKKPDGPNARRREAQQARRAAEWAAKVAEAGKREGSPGRRGTDQAADESSNIDSQDDVPLMYRQGSRRSVPRDPGYVSNFFPIPGAGDNEPSPATAKWVEGLTQRDQETTEDVRFPVKDETPPEREVVDLTGEKLPAPAFPGYMVSNPYDTSFRGGYGTPARSSLGGLPQVATPTPSQTPQTDEDALRKDIELELRQIELRRQLLSMRRPT